MEKTTNYPYIASCVWSYPGYAVDVVGSKFNMPTIEVVSKIGNYVCEYYKFTPDCLTTKSRKREFVILRHVAMFFIFTYTDVSLVAIGKHFGGRDHSTVLHALQEVKNAMSTDANYRANMVEIHRNLTKMVPVATGNGRLSFESVLADTYSTKKPITPFK